MLKHFTLLSVQSISSDVYTAACSYVAMFQQVTSAILIYVLLLTLLTTTTTTTTTTAPEIRGGAECQFSCCSDMYSVGVVMQEMFEGMIVSEDTSTALIQLVMALQHECPLERPTAIEALEHPFFTDLSISSNSNSSSSSESGCVDGGSGGVHDSDSQCCMCHEVYSGTAGIECTPATTTFTATTVNTSSTEFDSYTSITTASASGNSSIRHFICDGCMDNYVLQQAAVEHQQKLAELRGHIQCPGVGCCSASFDQHTIAPYVSKLVLTTLSYSSSNEYLYSMCMSSASADSTQSQSCLHFAYN
jgi:serine/threonine protein kinase